MNTLSENNLAENTREPILVRLRRTYKVGYDAVSMLVYLLLVFAWGLWVYPLGRDYAAMADLAGTMPRVVAPVFAWQMDLFGAWTMGYILINLFLLYGCMLATYGFVNLTVRGPIWLGVLAATLFMANPVHTEAVLNISGMVDLLPAFFALMSLAFYAAHIRFPARRRIAISVMAFFIAVAPFKANLALVLVIALYEWLIVPREDRAPIRLIPFALITILAAATHFRALADQPYDLGVMFTPLYFVFYPIGFLPETARTLHEVPALSWTAGGAVLVCVALIYRKARRPAILFGLLGMVGLRLYHGGPEVDPVHMTGGGQLLLESALFCLAFVALCHRIMDHPKWRSVVVWATTVLAITFFVLQIRVNLAWHHAGQAVQEVQAAAQAHEEARPDTPFALAPDFQYHLGAPMMLSEALSHDTPFSQQVPHVALFPLHYERPGVMDIEVLEWAPHYALLEIRGKRPIDVVPWPYGWSREGDTGEHPEATVTLTMVEEERFRVRIIPRNQRLPEYLLHGPPEWDIRRP